MANHLDDLKTLVVRAFYATSHVPTNGTIEPQPPDGMDVAVRQRQKRTALELSVNPK